MSTNQIPFQSSFREQSMSANQIPFLSNNSSDKACQKRYLLIIPVKARRIMNQPYSQQCSYLVKARHIKISLMFIIPGEGDVDSIHLILHPQVW